jgi:periplasmic protein TonB
VRCVTCQAEGITRRLYCECCGRELSVCQLEPDDDRTPETPSRSVASRCKGCGAPTVDGHDCGSCQQDLDSWLSNAEPAAAENEPTSVAAEESVWEELLTSDASNDPSYSADPSRPASSAEEALPAPLAPDRAAASANEPEAVKTEPAWRETAMAEPAEDEMTKVELATREAVKAAEPTDQEAPKTDPAAAAFVTETAEAPAVAATLSVTETPDSDNASKAVVFNEPPHVSLSSQQRSRMISVVAPVVILAAIGVGAYGLRIQGQSVAAPEEQPPVVREEPQPVIAADERVMVSAREVTAVEPQPPTIDVPAATSGNDRKATSPVPRVKPSAPPKSATAQWAAVKPQHPGPEQVAPLQASNLAPELHALAVAPAAPEVVSIPAPAPPSPARGPFFETTDVNESPQVATRVKPQLPDDLRALNELVVVRVLVSQGGHPSRVALLRKSKSGRRLDDAVIAAVNQWTFSPAKKRGEAVSCWFNLGVPIGRVDQ